MEAFPIRVEAGTLNLKNGTIGAASAFVDADGIEREGALSVYGGTVNIDGTKFENNIQDAINASYVGATGTIKNATFNVYNTAVGVYGGANVRIEDCNVNLNWDVVFASSLNGQSFATIAGGNYHSTSQLFSVHGGVITIEDGTFSSDKRMFHVYNVEGGEFIIKGGTFNGIAFENLTEEIIKTTLITNSCSSYVTVTKVDGAWHIAPQ